MQQNITINSQQQGSTLFRVSWVDRPIPSKYHRYIADIDIICIGTLDIGFFMYIDIESVTTKILAIFYIFIGLLLQTV